MLKKIFGLIGSVKNSPNSSDRERIQRATRVRVHPLTSVTFKRADASIADPKGVPAILSVANVSSSGIGFLFERGATWPALGLEIRGSVLVEGKEFPVIARVVRLADQSVGCAFLQDMTDLWKALEATFPLEITALRLERVNPEILKEESDGRPNLYRGGKHCELFYVEKDGQVVRFQLSFFGNYIEGGQDIPTKFGFLHGTDRDDKPKHKGTSLVRIAGQAPPEVMSAASRFVAGIPDLPEKQREQIAAAIRRTQ